MQGNINKFRSQEVVELYNKIIQHKLPKHISLANGAFVAVVVKGNSANLNFYNFDRSIKPLARLVEKGELVLMRDYYSEEELFARLNELNNLLITRTKYSVILTGNNNGKYSWAGDIVAYLHPQPETDQSNVSFKFQEEDELIRLLGKQ